MSLLIAATILVTAPINPVTQVDAAHDDLAAHRNADAIARIETGTATDHPASLINLAVAYAREGDDKRAYDALKRAARLDRRVHLETSSGAWMDSRELALRAMAALERKELARGIQTAMR